MKSGKSEAGHRAVSSHTASLAGDYTSFAAAVAQHNIIERPTSRSSYPFAKC
jgi:acyl-CoA synthetase (NDP forming)